MKPAWPVGSHRSVLIGCGVGPWRLDVFTSCLEWCAAAVAPRHVAKVTRAHPRDVATPRTGRDSVSKSRVSSPSTAPVVCPNS